MRVIPDDTPCMNVELLCSVCRGPMSGKGSGACCLRCIGRALMEPSSIDELDDTTVTWRLGDYDLGPELGRGAMGVVYRAYHQPLKRDVAVKLILSSRFAGDAARKRFMAESELAAQLDHPNIVPIYEVGESAEGPFYAMKLLEGGTLASIIQSGATPGSDGATVPRDARWAASLMVKVARAVHHAHQRGVLHRDLKPANILLDSQGEPHITDFGLARGVGTESSLTQSGSSVGTPAYMSPEQAAGEKGISTVSDVWSLGAILYHLLAGRPPFPGNTAVEVMRRVMDDEPVPFSESFEHRHSRVTRFDSDLETICLKCLRKDPAARYTTAGELAADLERWLNHEPINARPVSTPRRFVLWCRRRPALLVVWVALTVAAFTGLLAWQWRWETRLRESALREVQEKLAGQTVAAIRAERKFGQPGRRLDSLPRLAATAQMAPMLTLRNEAVASLALFDLHDTGVRLPLPRKSRNMAFTADLGQFVLGDGENGVVEFFRLSDSSRTRSVSGLEKTPGWLRLSPDARWLGGRWYDRIAIVPTETQPGGVTFKASFSAGSEKEYSFPPLADRVAIRFNLTGQRTDDGVKIVSLPEGKELATWDSPVDEAVCGVTFSPAGDRVAVLQQTWLTVLNATNGAALWSKQRDASPGVGGEAHWSFAWHPDGESLVAADRLGSFAVWSAQHPPIRLALPGQLPLPSLLQFGPDGDWLLTVQENNIATIWDYPGQRLLLRLEGMIQLATVSADFRRIGYVRDLTTKPEAGIWEPRPSDVFREVFVGEAARSIRLSADGEWLTVHSASNEVSVYRTANRRRADDAHSRRKVSAPAETSHRFEGPVFLPPKSAGREWRVNTQLDSGITGHFVWRENAGFSAYTESPALVRLINTADGITLCDLAPPNPEPVLDLAADAAGNLFAVLTDAGRVQLWNLSQLRTELTKLHLGWDTKTK